MKNLTSHVICILICLVPTFLAGQALQVQNQLIGQKAPLRSLQLSSMQPMTGSPLLRISNIGSSGQDGVSIELNSLSLTSPGPAVLFDCPMPGIEGSGAIRLKPSDTDTYLRVSNIGSSGQDGVAIDLGEAVVPSYRPRISMRKPLVAGTQSAIIIEPGEDSPYLRISNIGSSGQDGIQLTSQDDASGTAIFTTLDNDTGAIDFVRWGSAGSDSVGIRTFFDLELPGLNERISSASLDSFFDVFYDLNLGTVGTGFGQNPNNICAVRTFNPTTPSLLERISSNLPAVQSFFDVFVDLDLGTETRRLGTPGDPDFDLLRITSYDKATPKLLDRVMSTHLDSFFDVFYDLNLATTGVGFGFDPDDLCLVNKFDLDAPSLQTIIQSSDPLYLNSFFDITYDLDSGTVRTEHENLVYTVQYRESDWDFSSRISSEDPLVPSFFDISYDLNLGQETHMHGDPDFDLLRITSYDKTTPKLVDRVMSTQLDSFFDVFYDLNLAVQGVGFGFDPDDLCLVNKFDLDPPSLQTKIQSSNPLYLNSFFDITYRLDSSFIIAAHKSLARKEVFDSTFHRFRTNISSNVPSIPSFFDITYDLALGKETRRLGTLGDPDFDLLCIRTYDKATPKLLEKIASSNPSFVNSFFDITYDLNYGGGHGAGKVQFQDLHFTNDFDPATPKLLQRVASDNPLFADSFFDITYDLNAKTIKVSMQDFHFTRRIDAAVPMMLDRIASLKPGYVDSFFDITYDIGARAAKVQFEDILITRSYDPLLPRIQERLSDVNADSFFDIITSLDAGTETHVFGDNTSDLRLIRTFDKTAHLMNERILDSSLPTSFFDITYTMAPAGGGGATGKVQFQDFHFTKTYDAATPKLLEHIASSKPGFENSFFDITYDLGAQFYKVKFNDLLVTSYFISTTPMFEQKISSSLLPYIESFFDITYDISDIHVQKQSTMASAAGGMMPLELRYEYDALSRRIREVSTDLGSSVTLALERRLSPIGSSLFVSSKLEVQGAVEVQGPVSTPGAGPLTIADNVMINGTAHQINGSVVITGPLNQVNGNLHVTGTLTAGTKLFTIDHPLDPENKYLIHSCVESPDMMNVYNGNTITNDQGYVTVTLPDYFEALNTDFRYQLTCMGQFAQAIVAEKIKDNQFIIRTDMPNVEVSWQVTGIRNDPASKRDTYAVELEKEQDMKGKLLYVKQ